MYELTFIQCTVNCLDGDISAFGRLVCVQVHVAAMTMHKGSNHMSAYTPSSCSLRELTKKWYDVPSAVRRVRYHTQHVRVIHPLSTQMDTVVY
jgi:hypothetical protein